MTYDSARKHGHTFGEAFMIMWYACQACPRREQIFNSRDGVTPFCIACPDCGGTMQHVHWQLDEYAPNHKPRRGQRFFRDGTPDEAEQIMRERIRVMREQGYETSDEKEAKLIAIVRASAEGQDTGIDGHEFRKGWPMLDVAVDIEIRSE